MREAHGYPELTPGRKRKVFGLNALKPYGLQADVMNAAIQRDRVAVARAQYRQHPDPHFRTNGPKTRREFMNLMRWTGGKAT